MPEDLDGALAPAAPPAARPRPAGARGRGRPAAVGHAALATRRAAPDRPQGRPAPAGRHLRRPQGHHRQPGVRRPGRGRGRRPARRAVRELARADDDRDAAAPGHQEGRRPSCTARPRAASRSPGTTGRRGTSSTPATRCSGVLGAGAAKRRQVDAFLRVLQAAVAEADLPAGRPLRVVDLGCGNAYLTFAAYRFLAGPARVRAHRHRPAAGDARAQHRAGRRARLGRAPDLRGRRDHRRGRYDRAGADVVLALHACDTATDDALAQAVHWDARVVLASPAATTTCSGRCRPAARRRRTALVARHAILRERLGDVLTDAVRAALLRRVGYHVEVVQFVVRGVHAAQHDDPRGPHHRPAARPRGRRGVRRAASPTGASRRTCRRCSPTTLPAGLARSRRWRGCCSPPRPAPHVVLTLQDPSITSRAGWPCRHGTPACCGPTTTAAAVAQVVGRRPAGRDGGAGHAAPGSTPTTRRRLRPGSTARAGRRCSSATSATTSARRSDVSVFRFTRAGATCRQHGRRAVVPLHLPRRAARRRGAARRARRPHHDRDQGAGRRGPLPGARRLVTADRGSNALVRVADVPALVTDGAYLPDGRFVLRTYTSVYVYDRPGTRWRAPRCRPSRRASRSPRRRPPLLVGSEGKHSQILAVPVPGPPTVSPSPTGASASPAATPAAARDAAEPDRSGPALAIRVLGVVMVAAGAVLFVRRRRRQSRTSTR